jgi:hypothetical protein
VSAVTVVSEILTTLDPAEIEKNVLPVVVKLSTDPDDILLCDLINCVGIIAGCARAPEILRVVRELFTEWFKKKPETKLLVLHAFSSIIADTDTAFQDSFILPMFLDCVRELESWADPVTVEKASSLIVETVYAIESVSDDAIAASIRPIIVGLNPFLSLVTREKVDEIRDRYDIPAPDV